MIKWTNNSCSAKSIFHFPLKFPDVCNPPIPVHEILALTPWTLAPFHLQQSHNMEELLFCPLVVQWTNVVENLVVE